MEQIKKTVRMISPEEGADTHLEAHKKINAAVTQFYGLFNSLIKQINILSNKLEDAEEKNFASFSKLEESIEGIRNGTQLLVNKIQELEEETNKGGKFLTRNYTGIVDTDKETIVELDPITDEDLKGRHYLANIVVNEASPNQGAIDYSFPKTSIVKGLYTPRISLKAKDGEHAVLEYDFNIILTEI